jgi:poly-gamma-glutamate synthesis protein (capsule biosynthesis protein)
MTVPHHLLAADLLAEAFSRLSGQNYRRIVILCPDHYSRSQTPFAVAVRDFETCLGTVPVDAPANARLLASPLVAPSNLFAQEHGIQALTPFLARFFPGAGLVAVAIRKTATPAQWDELAAALTPLLDEKTLLVQSTDFSHYLSPAQATRMDQQTLRLLADPDPKALLQLDQPGHVDCRGALYLQRKLQQDVYRATPTTVTNRNSQAYSKTPITRSTSYMVQYYSPDPASLPGPNRFVFAGDTFLGRFMARLLARPGKRRELVTLVREATGGAPMVVNLEGVLNRRCPKHPGPYTLCMDEAATLDLLRKLHVAAVGLANNHVLDCGPAALGRMKRTLGRAGIAGIVAGTIRDLGPFQLAALTDLDNAAVQRQKLLRPAAIGRLLRTKQGKKLFAMIHWGAEFAAGPGEREQALARALRQAGAELVIGAHPHRSWPVSADKDALVAWSLGNFLFDQKRPEASGSLVEVRFFSQGTYALRVIPLGNLYARLGGSSAIVVSDVPMRDHDSVE